MSVTRPGLTLSAPAEWIDHLVGVLLDNACKFAPPDGHVWATVEWRDGGAWLVVEDDGPGIPDVQREQIFDRFHRGSIKAAGTGLGLAIGDAIVQATGGRWQVGESALGGARVAVGWTVQAP